MNQILYKAEAFAVIGKCMEVHRTLGHGFLEAVYKEALEYEFTASGIPYDREHVFDIRYKDVILSKKYCADFTVYNKIVLEVKAIEYISPQAIGQAINYLNVSGYRLCILVNFGGSLFEFRRFVL